jgi:DNA helicase HerA-like ATPase
MEEEQSIKIGHVVSISVALISSIIEEECSSEAVQFGALVTVPAAGAEIFGLINNLRTDTGTDGRERRLFDIELLGEPVKDSMFERGVSIYPTLGASVYIAAAGDLAKVYARPDVETVQFGTIHQDRALPAYAMTDKLLSHHFAILGTTGSGKSCAAALILHSILKDHHNSHVIFLDPHNEYAQSFGDAAELIDLTNLRLPYWLLNFEETVEVLVSREGAHRDSEMAILKSAMLDAKRLYAQKSDVVDHITVDTPVPYHLGSLVRCIEDQMSKLDRPDNTTPYLRLQSRIETLKDDVRFSFMFSGLDVRDNMGQILSRLMRVPVDGKPMTIIDLSGVPSEIVDVVVSMLCWTVFDFALWNTNQPALPVLLVCEEAHRYISADDSGFGPTKQVMARIAKEGRKYGVSLCLVSQRPSELSLGILSQCNTLFVLRMSNGPDQDFVRNAVPESGLGLLNSLPALRMQEAIVGGEGVTVPMRIRFNDLAPEQQPRSGAVSFAKAWREDLTEDGFVAETIKRWRHQAE